MQSQPELFQIVAALDAAGGFPDFLHRGEQQGDEHTDNGNYHQQFD